MSDDADIDPVPTRFSRPPVRGLPADEQDSVWKGLDFLGDQLDRIEKAQLSTKELDELRALLDADRKAKWLWASVRTWALWVTAVVAGFTIGVDALKALLKRLMS